MYVLTPSLQSFPSCLSISVFKNLLFSSTNSNLSTLSTTNQVSARFLALKEKCIHPTTKSPYILSAIGGRNVSTEKIKVDYSHCFVMTFQNKKDLQYYLEEDQVHLEFVNSLGDGSVVKIGVVDFEEGMV